MIFQNKLLKVQSLRDNDGEIYLVLQDPVDNDCVDLYYDRNDPDYRTVKTLKEEDYVNVTIQTIPTQPIDATVTEMTRMGRTRGGRNERKIILDPPTRGGR